MPPLSFIHKGEGDLWPQHRPGPTLGGRVLLEKGTRQSTVDPSVKIDNLDDLLRVLEINRKYRQKKHHPTISGSGPIAERLRGLFGSGK